MLNKELFDGILDKLPDDKKALATITLTELIEIDKRLDELRTKAFIVSNPDYNEIKRKSLEYEIYKDLLAQKNLYIKTFFTLINRSDVATDDNPLANFKEDFEKYFK